MKALAIAMLCDGDYAALNPDAGAFRAQVTITKDGDVIFP